MPPRQRAGRRGVGRAVSRFAGAAAAGVASGAYKAGRKVTSRIGQAIKYRLKSGKTKSRMGKNMLYSGQTKDVIGGGNDWTVSKRRVGRKKPNTVVRLSKMVEAGMTKTIYRFQGLTNFDTNVGFFGIGNYSITGSIRLPVHIYDLTSFPNNSTVGAPPVAYYYNWTSTAATADIQRLNYDGQTPTGTLSPGWNVENGLNTSFPNTRIMRHDWSDIRINFYGPRKRTTKFEVMFVRIKDEFANPLIAATNNAALKELMAYLERPCIYSNLQTYQTNVAKKLQIVKKFTYWVSAGQTTDVDTTVGKIKEARIFMRHGNVYSLDWRHEGTSTSTLSHVQADGAHYVQDVQHHNNPWHGSRLMMIIRAFAPERRTDPVSFDANVDPTYDILIRNQISTPY